MYYIKPTLKNLSQGARLEYIRKFRHMSLDDVAEYFGYLLVAGQTIPVYTIVNDKTLRDWIK